MNTVDRRSFLVAATGAALVLASVSAATSVLASPGGSMTVFKSPWCGCCGAWVDHIKAHGFAVDVVEMDDLAPIKERYGVAPQLQSCHTALIDGYVVEGHVPAQDVARLIAERPAARGIAVPGMPIGSPGMEQGDRRDRYAVLLFGGDQLRVFSEYP